MYHIYWHTVDNLSNICESHINKALLPPTIFPLQGTLFMFSRGCLHIVDTWHEAFCCPKFPSPFSSWLVPSNARGPLSMPGVKMHHCYYLKQHRLLSIQAPKVIISIIITDIHIVSKHDLLLFPISMFSFLFGFLNFPSIYTQTNSSMIHFYFFVLTYTDMIFFFLEKIMIYKPETYE